MVILSCLCNIMAMFVDELAGVADIVDFIADIVTAIVSSCLLAQTHLEVWEREPCWWALCLDTFRAC